MNIQNPHRILFERPDLAELTRQYTVVDPPFHTYYSDGFNSVAAIVKRARELNIGIAITDHNDIRGAVELDRYKNFLSIPGIEITSKEGTHILVYFYDIKGMKSFYKNDLQPNMGHDNMSSTSLEMEEIIERARTFDTVIVFSPSVQCHLHRHSQFLLFTGAPGPVVPNG